MRPRHSCTAALPARLLLSNRVAHSRMVIVNATVKEEVASLFDRWNAALQTGELASCSPYSCCCCHSLSTLLSVAIGASNSKETLFSFKSCALKSRHWLMHTSTGDAEKVAKLYHQDAILLPTISNQVSNLSVCHCCRVQRGL